MKKLNSAFAVIVFILAVILFPFNKASAQAGGYMGVFGGYTFSPEASSWYYDYDYYYADNYDMDIDETYVFGFKLGYTLPIVRFLSFEFEYSYLHPDVNRKVLNYSGSYYASIKEGDVSLNNFMLNAIFEFPEGRIRPYFGAGFGFTYIDFSLSTSPYFHSDSDSDTVFAWQLMAGIDIDLSNFLSMDIGIRYFSTETESDHDDYYYYDYYSNHLDFETGMVTVGLKYRF